jgi:hypothetical protein
MAKTKLRSGGSMTCPPGLFCLQNFHIFIGLLLVIIFLIVFFNRPSPRTIEYEKESEIPTTPPQFMKPIYYMADFIYPGYYDYYYDPYNYNYRSRIYNDNRVYYYKNKHHDRDYRRDRDDHRDRDRDIPRDRDRDIPRDRDRDIPRDRDRLPPPPQPDAQPPPPQSGSQSLPVHQPPSQPESPPMQLSSPETQQQLPPMQVQSPPQTQTQTQIQTDSSTPVIEGMYGGSPYSYFY